MIMAKLSWCLVVVCLCGVPGGRSSQEVVMNMAKGFGAALEGCKQEVTLIGVK